jgi:HK97 family phage major capsid protein
MNFSTLRRRPRGFMGAPMANGGPTDLAGVMAAFERFSNANNDKIGRLEDAVDDMAAQLAAQKLNGMGGGSRARKDLAPFAAFVRKGTVQSGMATSNDPDGGYFVTENVDSVVQSQLVSLSPLRAYARIVTLGLGAGVYSFNLNRRGTVSGWVGETEARPETAGPKLARITPPEGEIYANPKTSQWLLDDSSFNVETFLQENISDEFAVQEGVAFVNGDGLKKPQGYLSRPIVATGDATRDFGSLQYVPSKNANSLPADGTGADSLIGLVYSLKGPYRVGPGVAWMMNSTTASVVRTLKDPNGRYVWTDGLQAGEPARLLGYPVGIDENMPDLGANNYPIAFGNWQLGYRIVDRIGIRMLRDPFTDKPNVQFYTTKRIGGCVADSNAIKLLKCAAN